MKKLAIVLLAACMIAAIQSKATSIPSQKLEDYKTAVLLRLGALGCAGFVDRHLARTQSGTIDDKGAQPLLIFTYLDGETREDVRVVTSSDFKSVISVDVLRFKKQVIDNGDLANPKISTGMVYQERVAYCEQVH